MDIGVRAINRFCSIVTRNRLQTNIDLCLSDAAFANLHNRTITLASNNSLSLYSHHLVSAMTMNCHDVIETCKKVFTKEQTDQHKYFN